MTTGHNPRPAARCAFVSAIGATCGKPESASVHLPCHEGPNGERCCGHDYIGHNPRPAARCAYPGCGKPNENKPPHYDMRDHARFGHDQRADCHAPVAAEPTKEIPVAALVEFWERCYGNFTDGMIDVGMDDFQEWCEELGLIKPVVYDPKIHGEVDDAEPGDTIYTRAFGRSK